MAEAHDVIPKRRGRTLTRRLVVGVLPTVVWLAAIAAACQLYYRLQVAVTVTGYAEDGAVKLSHPEPGVVRYVHVRLHDRVTSEQILVEMDDQAERATLASIEKDIERLKADVVSQRRQLEADNARATADVVDLTRRFAVDRETAHVDYLAEIARDARDRILLRGAHVELEILRPLYKDGQAPWRELNDIQTTVDSLTADIERNAETLKRKRLAYEEADRRWADYVRREAVAVPYEPVLTPLRLTVEVRKRELQELVHHIDAHVLRSPIEGQVTDLGARTGDHVLPGSVLVMVSPTSTNRVVAYLPEQAALSTQVGTLVRVTPLANPTDARREYTGKTISLSAAITEAPLRHRTVSTLPMWGRSMVVELTGDAYLLPGEAVALSSLSD